MCVGGEEEGWSSIFDFKRRKRHINQTCDLTGARTRTHMCTRAHTCAHAHTHVHTHTHMCTRTHTCAHAHTHTTSLRKQPRTVRGCSGGSVVKNMLWMQETWVWSLIREGSMSRRATKPVCHNYWVCGSKAREPQLLSPRTVATEARAP